MISGKLCMCADALAQIRFDTKKKQEMFRKESKWLTSKANADAVLWSSLTVVVHVPGADTTTRTYLKLEKTPLPGLSAGHSPIKYILFCMFADNLWIYTEKYLNKLFKIIISVVQLPEKKMDNWITRDIKLCSEEIGSSSLDHYFIYNIWRLKMLYL